jgi:hypothetical protein
MLPADAPPVPVLGSGGYVSIGRQCPSGDMMLIRGTVFKCEFCIATKRDP